MILMMTLNAVLFLVFKSTVKKEVCIIPVSLTRRDGLQVSIKHQQVLLFFTELDVENVTQSANKFRHV